MDKGTWHASKAHRYLLAEAHLKWHAELHTPTMKCLHTAAKFWALPGDMDDEADIGSQLMEEYA